MKRTARRTIRLVGSLARTFGYLRLYGDEAVIGTFELVEEEEGRPAYLDIRLRGDRLDRAQAKGDDPLN